MRPAWLVGGLVGLALAASLGASMWGSGRRCAQTAALLQQDRSREVNAVSRAAAWLDRLPVDPVQLRLLGQKGKKHLVEALMARVRLHQIAPESEKAATLEKIRALTAITSNDAYHDLSTIDDLAFKQDATSYLRAALLMESVGLDTTRYREEIRRIAPRLDAQMKIRGVHQRLAFAWYYPYFGLKEPFPLAAAFKNGVISQRVDPRTMTKSEIYDLTHEIFVPFHYGDLLDAQPFTADEKAWLSTTLPTLLEQRIAKNDPDLVAELVTSMRYLHVTGGASYAKGLRFLLDSQRADGAWGHYEQYRGQLGSLVDQAYVLHTTMVAIDALTIAFDPRWNASPKEWCE